MSIIVRLRTKEKMERLEISPETPLSQFKNMIKQNLHKPIEKLSLDTNGRNVLSDDSRSLKSYGISNGTIVYLTEPHLNEAKIEQKTRTFDEGDDDV